MCPAVVTLVQETEERVVGAYYNGLLKGCNPDKSADFRFFVRGAHVKLSVACAVHRDEVKAAIGILERQLQPRWLLVSPCGVMSYADSRVLADLGVSVRLAPVER